MLCMALGLEWPLGGCVSAAWLQLRACSSDVVYNMSGAAGVFLSQGVACVTALQGFKGP